MTDDLIGRAEALIRDAPAAGHNLGNWHRRVAFLFPSLVAALKDAYREIERLKAQRPLAYPYSPPKAWDGKEPWPGDAVREAWK